MKKLKIVLVTQTYLPTVGGISTYVSNVEQMLKNNGHEVIVLNFDSRTINYYKKVKFRDFIYTKSTLNEYYNIFKLFNPLLISKLGGIKDFIFQNMVYREAKHTYEKFKPDLIYLLNAKLYSAVYDLKVPYIVTCYSEEILNTFPIKYSLNHANKISCITSFTKNLVLSIVPKRKKDIELIYTGIYLKKYINTKLPKKDQIITLCRLEKRKNVISIIKAYSILPRKIKDKYKYIIVGDGEERISLEKVVDDLELKNNIIFKGIVDEDTKIKLLAQSKIYVMCPTNYLGEQEGFGITYIEAQATGVPTIGSNIGGASEAIGNGGIIVKNELDISEISTKITDILSNKMLYTQIVKNINVRLIEFDYSTWAKKTINMIYSSLEL